MESNKKYIQEWKEAIYDAEFDMRHERIQEYTAEFGPGELSIKGGHTVILPSGAEVMVDRITGVTVTENAHILIEFIGGEI